MSPRSDNPMQPANLAAGSTRRLVADPSMDSLMEYAFDQSEQFSAVGHERLSRACTRHDGQGVSDILLLWKWAKEESERVLPHLKGHHSVTLYELMSGDFDGGAKKSNWRLFMYSMALAVVMQQARQWCELDTKCPN